MPPFFIERSAMECEGFWDCLGVSLGSGVTHSLLLLLAVVVAVISVRSAKATARRKQSADLLLHNRKDAELVKALRCVAELHDKGDGSIRGLANKGSATTDQSQLIRYALNHWEYVSVGVQAGIYDEDMLLKASFNTVVTLHKNVSPFIDGLREIHGRDTLYQEFRWLATRWEEKGLAKKK